jgi:hypothetical protein
MVIDDQDAHQLSLKGRLSLRNLPIQMHSGRHAVTVRDQEKTQAIDCIGPVKLYRIP